MLKRVWRELRVASEAAAVASEVASPLAREAYDWSVGMSRRREGAESGGEGRRSKADVSWESVVRVEEKSLSCARTDEESALRSSRRRTSRSTRARRTSLGQRRVVTKEDWTVVETG